ncbi:MAG TPA: prepilin-type N-terminal cleavage/methylation domain-containing protein [Patescibacteria group bacterium]|nr:prepilin-type N-terminal cleavage/methylation domain-containing protein [Patescibacteria group bacterium]
MEKEKQKQRGFTLVELILYIGLSAFLLSSVGVVMNVSYQTKARQQVITEVEQQGTAALQSISQIIRNASSIISPAAGVSATSVSVNVSDLSKTPTTFFLSDSVLQAVENTIITPLTTTRVQVSAVSFKNLSAVGSPGTVKFQFMVAYNNPGGSPRFVYSKIFYGSASLR